MVWCRLGLLPLDEVVWEEEPGFLYPWYDNDAAMMGPTGHITILLCTFTVKLSFYGHLL